MERRIRTWIAVAGILFLPFSSYADKSPLKVSVSADAAILIDADTGTPLFEKNADASLFPASITKVATALYILDKHGHRLREEAVASKTAVAWAPVHLKRSQSSKYPSFLLESGATHISLQEGERATAATLFEGMLIASANDAANVLAEHLSGSIPRFVEGLNVYLRSKGFNRTRFDNPHGLYHADHQTTARDMAGIAREAMKFPLFREIVGKELYNKPQTNKQPPTPFAQGNRLLRPGKYFYPHATGIKTGYTFKSKCTLVASAEKHDRRLIAVVLGSQDNDQRYRDTIAMFEAAFAEKKASRLLLTKKYDTFNLNIKGAKQPLRARMQDDLVVDYYPSQEPQVSTRVEWDVRRLPIQKGQVVGSILLLDQKQSTLKKIPLAAIDPVDPTFFWKTRHYAYLIMSMTLTKVIFLAMIIVTALAGYIFFRLKEERKADTKG